MSGERPDRAGSILPELQEERGALLRGVRTRRFRTARQIGVRAIARAADSLAEPESWSSPYAGAVREFSSILTVDVDVADALESGDYPAALRGIVETYRIADRQPAVSISVAAT